MTERAPKAEQAPLPPIELKEWEGSFWQATAAQAASEKHPEGNQDVIMVSEKIGLITLCDGMGGHEGGREAAATVAAAVHEYFEQLDWDLEDHEVMDVLPESMIKAIRSAQTRLINERADRPQEQSEMDTTVTSLLLHKLTSGTVVAIVGHVGNGRAYAVEHSGQVRRLTEDQDLMSTLDGAKLVLGDIPEADIERRKREVRREVEEAASKAEMSNEAKMLFAYRNMTMGVGSESMTVAVDVYRFPENGSIALLTDGVFENIGRATGGYLSMVPVQPHQEVAQKMILSAQQNGRTRPNSVPTAHPDDCSVVIVKAT